MSDDLRFTLGLSAIAIIIILSIAALIIIAKSWPSTKSDFIKFQPSELSIMDTSDDWRWNLSPGATIEIQAAVEFSITNESETITMTSPLTLTVQ